ncbi:MAG: hypothetical protein QOE59_4603 [Actinomycetota bacterium]|nr:hypothetical protein [Actinomycetota bacterium]
MRKTVAMIAAVVVAVLAVVSARALASPIAWAAAAVLVVATAAAVATLSLTPAAQRVVVALGAILGLGAIALAVVEFGVRGYRTSTSAPLLGLVAGIAGLLVVLGVAAARSAPTPTALWTGAAVIAALGLVAGVVVTTTVPYLPLSRNVTRVTATNATTVTLDAPDGVTDGDVLVAQVYRAGAGEVRGPQGWVPLRTTPLPGAAGSVALFTTTAAGDSVAPATFSTDTPTSLVGGVGAWSHIGAVTAPGEASGTGGVVTATPAPADPATKVLYFVSAVGIMDLPAPAPLGESWLMNFDDETTALFVRPALDPEPAAPVSLTPSAPVGPWAVQTVVLQAE